MDGERLLVIDTPVMDQGELGADAAFAAVACMEYMLKHPPKEVKFIYYEVRPLSSDEV